MLSSSRPCHVASMAFNFMLCTTCLLTVLLSDYSTGGYVLGRPENRASVEPTARHAGPPVYHGPGYAGLLKSSSRGNDRPDGRMLKVAPSARSVNAWLPHFGPGPARPTALHQRYRSQVGRGSLYRPWINPAYPGYNSLTGAARGGRVVPAVYVAGPGTSGRGHTEQLRGYPPDSSRSLASSSPPQARPASPLTGGAQTLQYSPSPSSPQTIASVSIISRSSAQDSPVAVMTGRAQPRQQASNPSSSQSHPDAAATSVSRPHRVSKNQEDDDDDDDDED